MENFTFSCKSTRVQKSFTGVKFLALFALLFAMGVNLALGDNYVETYTNPTGSNTPARANGLGAFSVIGNIAGNISFGNSSLQINTNGGSGTFTINSLDGSYITSILFTQNGSYPINSLTSSQGTITGPVGDIYTFTPNSATSTSATFSMSAQSGKKVRVAPIVVNLTSTYEYFSKNFSISSGTVSCTKSNASSDITMTTTGSISNNGISLSSSKTLTITSSGHNIKSIHFTLENHNTAPYSASEGTYSSNTWTKSSDVKSVTFTSSGSSVIVGISIELESAGCASYSFHYGTDGESGWQQECFVTPASGGVEHEMQVTNFTIPSTTHFYVGNQGTFEAGNAADKANSVTTTWASLYFAHTAGSGDKPMVGQATGATGTIRIYNNSTWNNKQAAFLPDGYSLKFGSTYGLFTETATMHQFQSPLVQYNSTSASYNISVGVIDANDAYVATNNTQEMRHIFLNTGGTSLWSSGNCTNFAVYYNDGSGNWSWTSMMTKVPGEDYIYEMWLPSGSTTIEFVRLSTDTPDWGNKWNQTGNITQDNTKNLFTITQWDDQTTGWSVYEKEGRFRMNRNYDDKNWYVRFVPNLVLTYDKNNASASGTMEKQGVDADAASKTVTVQANGFTPPSEDHIFTGWNTQPGGGGTSYAAGSTYSLTADATLYAQWVLCSGPTITSFVPAGKTDGTYNTGETLGSLTVTATAGNGGALSYKWYQYDDATGKVNAVEAAGTNNAATYNIPNNAACTARHYFCVVSEAGCSTTRESAISGALTLNEVCVDVNASVVFDNNNSDKYNTSYSTSTDIVTTGGATYSLSNCSSDGEHAMTKPAIKGNKNNTLITLNIPAAATSGSITVKACTYSGGAATIAITNSAGTVLSSGGLGSTAINSPDGGSWTEPTLATISYNITEGGTYYIKETSGSNNVYIYAFSATGINTCCNAAPANPDGLTAGSITSDGVTFTISDDESPTSYDIYYSTSSSAPTASTPATTTTTDKTKAVTGLTGGTTYYAWVRAVCDAEYKSAWVALTGSSFTTSAAPATYSITFNCNGAESGCPANIAAATNLPNPLPTGLTKTGYEFEGWYTNEGLTIAAVAGDELSANVTLYAKWVVDCKISLSKVVLTSATEGTVTGYNGGEFAGNAVIGGLSGSNTAEVDPSHGGNETGYKLNSSGSAIVFATLKKGSFHAGDIVKVTITKENDNYTFPSPVSAKTGMDIYYGTNASDATLLATLSGVSTYGTYSYTLTAADVTTIGSKKGIGIFRKSDRQQNHYVYSVEILGCREFATVYNFSNGNFADWGSCVGGNLELDGSQVGVSYQLYKDDVASGSPKAGTGSALRWHVDASGVYTVRSVENASYEDTNMYGTANVTIQDPTIVGESAVVQGETITLNHPGYTTGGSWDSSDPTKATVDGSGVVTGVAEGTVTITFHGVGGYEEDGTHITICNATKVITVTKASICSTLTHFGKQYRTSDPRRGYAYAGSLTGSKYIVESNKSNNQYISSDSAVIRLDCNSYIRILDSTAVENLADSTFQDVSRIAFKWKFHGSSSDYTTTVDVYVGGQKVASAISLTGNNTDGFALHTITVVPAASGTVRFVNKGSDGKQSLYLDDIDICVIDYDACKPQITAQPIDASYNKDAAATVLTVTTSNAVDTYQWYSNTEDSNEGGISIPGATSASYTPPTSVYGTIYYYCVLTNECGSTVSDAAAITVVDPRPAPTADWTGTTTNPKHGGGGYTVTVVAKNSDGSALWDGTLSEDMLYATDGVVLGNIVVDNTTKTITATYGVTDEVASSPITFTLSLPASTIHRAADLTFNVTIAKICEAISTTQTYTFESGEPGNPLASDFDVLTSAESGHTYGLYGTLSSIKASNLTGGGSYFMGGNITTSGVYATYTTKDTYLNIDSIAFYECASDNTKPTYVIKVINPSTGAEVYTSSSLTHSTIKGGSGTNTWTGRYVLDLSASPKSGKVQIYVTSGSSGKYYAFDNITVYSNSDPGDYTTTLIWDPTLANGATVTKTEADLDFQYEAQLTGENSNTLGHISYSSSNTSAATVDATGRVHIADNINFGGAEYVETTITATLSPSGCYKGATITYILRITPFTCTEAAGTINVVSATCSAIELSLSGYETGATVQWYKDGVSIPGATDATYTATTVGEYYAVTHLTCNMPSTNSATVSFSDPTATALIDEWYVKNGRRTPDIELAEISNFTYWTVKKDGVVIWNSDGSVTTGYGGCEFYEQDGIVYLAGQKPNGDEPDGLTPAPGTVTFVITASNGCSNVPTGNITIHQQATTLKPNIAFVVDGTKGGDIDAVTAAKTSDRPLWIYLSDFFDLTGCNAYWTTVTKKLRQYYSQYDAIMITDDPNTGTKSESTPKIEYIKAMGNVVDVRPILTLEAYVGKYTEGNWGVYNASPSSPNPRQYVMHLQCKEHAIYKDLAEDGTLVRKEIVDGIEEWFVTMVDKNVSPYSGLADNTDTEDTPALQGFDATKFSNMLGIGTIKDGELQGGVERQKEPAARMMILGIQHQAMAALTNPGKQIIKNAINYLLLTDMEDVEDCSNYFHGQNGTNTDWYTAANWSTNKVPDATERAILLAPCVVSNSVNNTALASSVDIAVGGRTKRYKSGASDCEGHLTINANGALAVSGTVRRLEEAPNFGFGTRKPTTAADISILSTKANGNGALVMDNADGLDQAYVEMYSKADTVSGWNWQYIGVPFTGITDARENYLNSWLYIWVDEAWAAVTRGAALEPFAGYCITYPSADHVYTMSGTLAPTTDQEISVGGEFQVVGNSWTAPIQIHNFEDADFENLTRSVYLFNTGSDPDGSGDYDAGRYATGTYLTIPIHTAPYTSDSLISSLQGFYVQSSSADGTLKLEYDKIVRPSRGQNMVAGAMHAPKRAAGNDRPNVAKLMVRGTNYDDELILLERGDFSRAYENGWDGYKLLGNEIAPAIWSVNADGDQEAVTTTPDLDGTLIGFRAGEDDSYTFQFEYDEEAEALYLLDTETQIYTRVLTGNNYTFTTADKAEHTRFILTRTTEQQTPTGCGNVEDESEHAVKFINNNKLYIYIRGVLYDATGKIVVHK